MKLFGTKRRENTICQLPQDIFTTDMHLHLLPGIDDGSPNLETSLEMAQNMVEIGIKEAYVTPHVIADVFPNTIEIIREKTEQLQTELDKEKINLKIYPAAEYRMDGDFLDILDKGEFQAIDNKYLLVENSFYQETRDIHNMFFKIQLLGYIPILAHPERYKFYQTDKNSYKRVKDMGCLLQINLLSLVGWYGANEKKISENLVKENMVDFIGTDMHKIKQAHAIKEYLKHSKNFDGIINKIGGNRKINKIL